MRIYISGPMSGLPYFNIDGFDAVARYLRGYGHEVISPAELDDPEFRRLCLMCETGTSKELDARCRLAKVKNATWGELLARDIKLLADDGIEVIVVLDGWTDSRGAILETMAARLLDIPVAKIDSDCGGGFRWLTAEELKNAHAHAAGRTHPYQLPGVETGEGYASTAVSRVAASLRAETVEQEIAAETSPFLRDLPSGEVRVTSETGGQKGSKEAVIGDICPKALMQVARVAGMGRRKYDRLNYLKGFDWSLSYDAAQRHLMLFWAGQDTDEESGLPHLAHAAWQCLCLLAFSIRDLGKDDRP